MSDNNDFQQIQKLSQEQVQVQRAHQNQVILGQLIEMNDEEIKDRIEMELDDNPALEQADSNDLEDDFSKDDDDDGNDKAAEVDRDNDDPFESPYTQSDDDYTDRNDDGLSFIQTHRRQKVAAQGYRPPVVNEESMFEVLMNQVRERDLDERQMLIAEYIIGEIDDDGLMRRPVTSICGDIITKENEFVTPQEVQEVLEVIHDLEPAGIGASSPRECIMLQIEDMKGVDPDVGQIAYDIINHHFAAYEKHHYDKILNDMGIDKELFHKADQIIKRTNPRPGNIFSSGGRMNNATHITPDFIVTTENDKLQLIVVNDIPELQISESYQIEYQRIVAGKSSKERDEDVLIKRQFENANNFIKLLKLRQEKLFNIMKAIMLKQQEFFLTGDIMTLKRMVLNDIAQATGYDVSTISRAHQNKYVDTNWGIFDLKFFFSSGFDENDQVSSRAIKDALRSIVDAEDKKHPLSDEQLCKKLQEKGFPIKRRTVAKYRDTLNIPVARQRKTL